ncbi:MAG TPA: hypothetical protein VK980_06895 [Sphingomonas sp.]|nr:hypothetical protein [Sphingomonas sp.]
MSFRAKLMLAILVLPCALGACTVLRNGYLPDAEARQLPLVVPGKKLPASVHNAKVHEDWYMEHTQTISFEAPLADARTFASAILKDKVIAGGDPGVLVHAGQGGWPDAGSAYAETGSGFPDGYRVEVAVLPAGENGRVWLYLSSR